MNLLNEVLDTDKLDLPVTNLYPKTKIPQIFSIGDPGPDNLPAFRMCSYTSGGDTNKNVKPGDKMIHVVMLTLNSKGSLVKLKGLGDDPIGVISTTFNIVYDAIKTYKMDAVLFRMNKTKVGGQARQLQVIMDRLVRTRTGGKFVILKELWDYDKKYSYILIHRKNVDLQTIPGIPEIDTKLFTKVDSKVGDVYVSKESGQQVTKAEALAKSIAVENDARSDQNVIARAKISRRQAISAQYSINADDVKGIDKDAQFEFKRLEAKVPVISAKEAPISLGQVSINSRFGRGSSALLVSSNDSVNFPRDRDGVERNDGEILRDEMGAIFARKKDVGYRIYPTDRKSARDIGFEEFTNNTAQVSEATQAAARVIANINTKNSFQSMKDLVKIANQGLPPSSDNRAEVIKPFMVSAFNIINKQFETAYGGSNDVDNMKYTDEEKEVIGEYCANMYEYMNNFLIGKPDEDYPTKFITKMIDTMDGAFEKGVRLEKGTILYRGQDIDLKTLDHNLQNKLFYFRNYVSTSFKPNIFGEFGQMFAHLDDETSFNTSDTEDEMTVAPDELVQWGTTQTNPAATVKLGFVITGAEAVKVIIPQEMSDYADEAEVILPRGTVLRISKATAPRSYSDKSSKFMIESYVVPSEQIDESALYDGDLFMETGEVKVLSGFEKFVTESVYDKEINDAAGELLAEFLDIDSLPAKFR